MDIAILTALYNWARANPVIAGIVAALWLAGVLWRGMPEAQRKSYEVRNPRIVGLLRVVLGLLPDPLVILRAFGLSVIAGKPHPGSVDASTQAPQNDRQTIPPVIVGDEQPSQENIK